MTELDRLYDIVHDYIDNQERRRSPKFATKDILILFLLFFIINETIRSIFFIIYETEKVQLHEREKYKRNGSKIIFYKDKRENSLWQRLILQFSCIDMMILLGK